MEQQTALYQYALRLADSSMIMAQRISEWCSNGPILEEDLALTNVALDYLGQAENFYHYALTQSPQAKDADSLAFRRNERQYRNALLAELPNGDYAQSMLKLALFSAWLKATYEALASSQDPALANLAEKSLKEVKYHYRHSSDWVIRFGQGTEESRRRLYLALSALWRFTGDAFAADQVEDTLLASGFIPDPAKVKNTWMATIQELFTQSGLSIPEDSFQVIGGFAMRHTEHLGHILCEMQYLQRAYPDAQW